MQTFDPSTKTEDKFELWSIPAFDRGNPELVKGAEIGSSKKIVLPGDTLLSRIVPHIRRGWVVEETASTALKLASTEWIIFNHANVLPKFLKRILTSDTFYEQFMLTITGVGGSLSRASIKAVAEIKIPVPPMSDQEEIVNELESYQKIIDGARMVVENYKPRIDIDPEWEMVELGEVCIIGSGGTPSRNIPEYWNGTIPWVGSTVCKDVLVTKSEEYITEQGLKKSAAKILPAGTTLIALVGATIGKTGYLTFPCTTNQNIAGLSPRNKEILEQKYLFYIAQSLYPKFMELSDGKFRMANLSFVKSLKIPIPKLNIQQVIVASIESEKKAVEGNIDLIRTYEQKIKTRIAKVWGM